MHSRGGLTIDSRMGHPGAESNLLDRRTAVVTGAGDIGAAIAHALRGQGAAVDVWDRSEAALERVAKTSEGIGTQMVDVTSASDLERATEEAVRRLGHVDILVNTAAVFTYAPVADMGESMWRETIDVNLTGVFLCIKAVLGHMIERKQGAIINISSVAGLRGEAGLSHYSAAKFGIIGLTQALAREVGSFGIRANCVSPGAISSVMNTDTLAANARRLGVTYEEVERQVVARTPLGRLGEPSDVAGAVIFLASDLAGFVSGHTLPVTGGVA